MFKVVTCFNFYRLINQTKIHFIEVANKRGNEIFARKKSGLGGESSRGKRVFYDIFFGGRPLNNSCGVCIRKMGFDLFFTIRRWKWSK